MSFIYDVDEEKVAGVDEKIPNLEHDISRAKMYLQRANPESGDSLYNHLAELLEKILSERPKNAIDIFEEYSKKLKDERYKSKTNYLREHYVSPIPCDEAKTFIRLYQNLQTDKESEDGIEDEEKDNDYARKPPDLFDLFFNLERIDVGLPRSEIITLNLSICKLIADKPIQNVRFWGKIIGKPKNYYVVETELLEDELLARRTVAEAEVAKNEDEKKGDYLAEENETTDENEKRTDEQKVTGENEISSKNEETSYKLQLIFPPMPKNYWKDEPIVPIEEIGTGLNGHVYYVTNSPGNEDWTELPLVTPQQIVAARQIVRMFTGELENPIYTFPPFPGTEKNYLRAQIARISAATLVSPIGFFTFDETIDEEDEEEADTDVADDEEAAGSGMILENRHYEAPSLKELIDPSLSYWCHHSPYILKQGRTVWWDPRKGGESGENENETDVEEEEEEVEDEEEEEDKEKEDSRAGEFQKEVGPRLLTPLSEDARLGSIVAWTARASSTIKSDRTAIAIVRSNIWPGSFTFATGKKFANVYIGMGQKFNPYNYSPPDMPIIQEQYNIGPEVMEIQDPSFEAEEAYRIAHLPSNEPGPLELDDEDEDEDEDEDDEDDEDDDDED